MTQQEWATFLSGEGVMGELCQALERLGFANPASAERCLRRLTVDVERRELFAAFAPHLFNALSSAGDPDRVLATFERFAHSAQDVPSLYRFLAARPRAVELLVRVFSGSQFLAEILLRSPEYLEDLIELRQLARPKTREALYNGARNAAEPFDSAADQMDALRRFQRWEMLRIGACDLLDLFDLPTATQQLSNLADALVQASLDLCAARLNLTSKGFAVMGMGKLGGQELNYSSDIDFIFLAAEPSPAVTRLAERLIDMLARVTTEGFLYRVDMRLRPWGQVGPLVSSTEGYISYLNRHALLWEKQALLKARVVAGDRSLGEGFIGRTRPLLFGGAVESMRADVLAMKTRTEAFVSAKAGSLGDVKLGEGSIRDVEFVAQFLQLAHGAEHPEILSPNTLETLSRLLRAGFLSLSEYRVLGSGYIFLRTIEHHLQIMDYRQTHSLPDDPEAILSLARRLGFTAAENGSDAYSASSRFTASALFLERYHEHAAAIRGIYLRILGRMDMKPAGDPQSTEPQPARAEPASEQVVGRHRARMSPSYAGRFDEAAIARHAALANQLNDTRLALVDASPADSDTWDVSIVAFDFPGELSLICGLMFVYGLDILKGDAFTYEPEDSAASSSGAANPRAVRGLPPADSRRKIVDVFNVRRVKDGAGNTPSAEMWQGYAADLEALLQMMRSGQRSEARGQLAKRVGLAVSGGATNSGGASSAASEAAIPLLPIGIEIDNDSSEHYTVLHIDTPDTVGFLYEFTTALSIHRIYIAQVLVSSIGNRVRDTLFVTDEAGRKITSPERMRELRAATVLIKHFTHLLPQSPNPESALLHFPEFISQLFKRPNWPDELGSLERPQVLHALARLLGVSDFLWDDFLRMQYANLYPVVTGVDALAAPKSRAQLQSELENILAGVHAGPQPLAEESPWQEELNRFKDREMFRIDMRHILGQTREFWDFARELTDLAEVVVNSAYHLCHEDLRSVYGSPRLDNGEISEMSVCALGKCGGRELGFASDIELMFIYSGNGTTTGTPQGGPVITTAEFYEKLVQNFVRAIRARREGIFEVDLQLRPYGKAGSLAVSLDAFRRYFAPDGPAWAYERQALVKLRGIAGNPGLGTRITRLRDDFVYTGEPFDVTAMRAMRERQIRHLVTGGMFNLKYSPGGLVDVEYLVQGLQITYGRAHAALRLTNTREAMSALAEEGCLPAEDYTRLRKAHTFLRWMIDSLRVVRGNARDVTVPPEGSDEFAYLTRRMLYGHDTARLREEMIRYTADVLEINRRLLS